MRYHLDRSAFSWYRTLLLPPLLSSRHAAVARTQPMRLFPPRWPCRPCRWVLDLEILIIIIVEWLRIKFSLTDTFTYPQWAHFFHLFWIAYQTMIIAAVSRQKPPNLHLTPSLTCLVRVWLPFLSCIEMILGWIEDYLSCLVVKMLPPA